MLPPVDSGESKFYGYIKSMFAAQSTAILKARNADPVLPRNMTKLVAKRKKAKIARSQMIVNNQEYQRQLLDTTVAHQRELDIQRLSSFLAAPTHTMALTPTVIQAGRIAQNRQAKLEDAALKTSMDSARVQLNKLIMAQEEYNRPLVRLRRMDQGNIMDRRR
jgi:acetoacetate decarboxylase